MKIRLKGYQVIREESSFKIFSNFLISIFQQKDVEQELLNRKAEVEHLMKVINKIHMVSSIWDPPPISGFLVFSLWFPPPISGFLVFILWFPPPISGFLVFSLWFPPPISGFLVFSLWFPPPISGLLVFSIWFPPPFLCSYPVVHVLKYIFSV